jgi:hypothetical protein
LGGVAGGNLPALGLGFGGIEFAAAAALLLLAEAAAPRQCLSLSSSSLSLWVLSPVCVFWLSLCCCFAVPDFCVLCFLSLSFAAPEADIILSEGRMGTLPICCCFFFELTNMLLFPCLA